MRLAWLLVVAACSSKPSSPPVVAIVPDASIDAIVDAATPRVMRSHEIATAAAYGCARTADAGVACWGETPGGTRLVPTRVAGLANVAGIAAGRTAVYAWSADGTAMRWRGRVEKLPLVDVAEIAADHDYACARHRDKRVSCWMSGKQPLLIDVRADEVVVANHHACARATSDVVCWTAAKPAPDAFADVHGAIALASSGLFEGGAAIFGAVMPDGTIVKWVEPTRLVVAAPKLPADVVKLSIGPWETCALGAHLACWQDITRIVPLDAVDVVVGSEMACVQMADGRVACWGPARVIGNGRTARTDVPVAVADLVDAVELGATDRGTCARRANGKVVCWGERLNSTEARRSEDYTPIEIEGVDDAIDLEVAMANACVRRKSGHVACWGVDDGTGATHVRATDVPMFAPASRLISDGFVVCGVQAGKLVCRSPRDSTFKDFFPRDATHLWSGGHIRTAFHCAKTSAGVTCVEAFFGHGAEDSGSGPTTLETDLSDVVDIHLPGEHTEEDICLVRKSGLVECREVYSATWRLVGIEDAVSIISGAGRPCVLRKTGTVTCWSREHPALVEVPNLRDAVELVGGGWHACARRKSGKVVCWGDMHLAGAGGRANTNTPVVLAM